MCNTVYYSGVRWVVKLKIILVLQFHWSINKSTYIEAVFNIKKYHPADQPEWDSFIDSAKNATFLFRRDFMDYHSDRFDDHSLLIYKDDTLFAVLPANRKDNKVISHQGLTYGSLVLQKNAKLLSVFEAFKAMLQFLSSEGIEELDMRVIPSFYNTIPSDELEYLLYLSEAKLLKRDVIMILDYAHQLRFQKNRREGINKAVRNGLIVTEDDNFEDFWNEILIPNLQKKHQAKPVHSLEEIMLLAKKFPKQIKQVNVYKDNKIVAGTTVFLTKTTVHPQYVSGNTDKNVYGSLDLCYDFIINHYKDGRRYFDFNTSSEEGGTVLNEGLLFWKESCGARTFVSNNYVVKTAVGETLSLKTK